MATPKTAFRKGFIDGAPFALIVMPFATLFGAIGTEAGLSIAQVMGFSVMVIAGAAQLTAVQLMVDQAPTFIVLLTSLAVNLRMAMYSASLQPYLGAAPLWQRGLLAYMLVDQAYTISVVHYENNPDMTSTERVVYFVGVVIPILPVWYGFTLLGALVGQAIPDGYGIDFAVPIAFLALIAPAMRTVAHIAAAAVAVVLGLALAWMPYSTGLLFAALAAMATGAEIERRYLA
ncbi:MAG: AzlC family ABC transporter permease [Pseudomonadota bacterium]